MLTWVGVICNSVGDHRIFSEVWEWQGPLKEIKAAYLLRHNFFLYFQWLSFCPLKERKEKLAFAKAAFFYLDIFYVITWSHMRRTVLIQIAYWKGYYSWPKILLIFPSIFFFFNKVLFLFEKKYGLYCCTKDMI